MKKLIGFLLITGLSCAVYAGFTGEQAGSSLGVVNKLNCSTGLICTKNADVLSIVSSPTLTGGSLTVSQPTLATAATLDLQANNNTTSGDDWQIKSTITEGGLQFLNNISGSQVQKMLLTTGGNLTVAGTSTLTGAVSVPGGITGGIVLTGAETISTTLAVTGATTLTGALSANGGFNNYNTTAPKTNWSTWLPKVAVTEATSTTPVATDVYMTQIEIPYNMTLTGINVLNAATVGTNKWILALFDSTGAVIANTALAGVLTSGASAYQQIAFTAPVAVKGPGTYWIAGYMNGTTDRFYTIPAFGAPAGLAGLVTGQTFGTVSAVTLPTTFTAAQGIIGYTY